jgi:eukaryotic-like serine/threonine-protein kinase
MGKDVDHRSDIFSLGVVLYEWLTGFKLFSGDNDLAVMNNIIEGKIYPPSYFRDGVPEVVETILMKALEKDRKRRYQSAWDMQFDIDTFLSSNEFTPSNVHLSNFMKQLFKDELEREQVFLARMRTPTKDHVIELGTENVVLEDAEELPLELPRKGGKPGDVDLKIRMDKKSLRRLTELAEKRGQTPAEYAEHMLKSLLKTL